MSSHDRYEEIGSRVSEDQKAGYPSRRFRNIEMEGIRVTPEVAIELWKRFLEQGTSSWTHGRRREVEDSVDRRNY